jgi:hypothetical protein
MTETQKEPKQSGEPIVFDKLGKHTSTMLVGVSILTDKSIECMASEST